jgi:hypothetical protein
VVDGEGVGLVAKREIVEHFAKQDAELPDLSVRQATGGLHL